MNEQWSASVTTKSKARRKKRTVWRRAPFPLGTNKLHKLYASPHFIRMIQLRNMRLTWHGAACSTHGKNKKCIKILVGKPGGKRPLGRPGCRCEDNSRTDLRDIGWEVLDWIHLAQHRDQWWATVNAEMSLQVP